MLQHLFSPSCREVYAKGCTSSGKTASVGLGICLYFDAYEDARVVLTSSTAEHVTGVLFAEVTRWFKAMLVPTPGARLLAEGIADNQGHYVVCVNPKTGEAFSGRHGRHTLLAFDEASSVPDERFSLADTQATKFIAMSNPRTMSGRFRLGYSPCQDPNKNETVLGRYGYRRCLTIDGADVLNVREGRLENPVAPKGGIEIQGRKFCQGEPIPEDFYDAVRPIIPGQLCLDTYLGHCDDPDTRWAECFAHGRFPAEDPQTQVLLSSWFDRHFEAFKQSKPAVTAFALDPADSEHGDSTMLAAGGSEGLAALHERKHEGAMETVAWVLLTAESEYGIDLKRGEVPVVIDMDGMGKGWASRLKELGVRVVEYAGNTPADDKRRYVNRRAEGYGVLGARLDPKGVWANVPWAMPADSQLVQDLCAPEKIYDSDGFRFRLTPKCRQPGMPDKAHTLREKLGRSPDRGDATVMLYWAVHSGGSMATTAVSRWKINSTIVKDWEDKPADTQNRGCHASIGAVYEDRRFSTLGCVVLGLNFKDCKLDLLRVESWDGLPPDEAARKIRSVMEPHKVEGVAINTQVSAALAGQLDGIGAPLYDSPLTPADRNAMAQRLVDAFELQLLRLYRHEGLVGQLAALPLRFNFDGATLDDPEDGTPQMELGMSFAIAVWWAAATLQDEMERVGAVR